MKNRLLKPTCSVFLTLVLLLLLSCATPKTDDTFSQDFDPTVINTIGLFPITYDKSYPPPMPNHLNGRNLSTMLTRQIEKVLSQKGYKLKLIDLPPETVIDDHLGPLKLEPAALAENCPPELDGLMQVHVTFHFGINLTERSGDKGPFTRIYMNAIARMIDKKGPEEVWRKSGRARPFASKNFSNRLNYAVFTLANGLLENFPDKNQTSQSKTNL